jgi:hypothetical protein
MPRADSANALRRMLDGRLDLVSAADACDVIGFALSHIAPLGSFLIDSCSL